MLSGGQCWRGGVRSTAAAWGFVSSSLCCRFCGNVESVKCCHGGQKIQVVAAVVTTLPSCPDGLFNVFEGTLFLLPLKHVVTSDYVWIWKPGWIIFSHSDCLLSFFKIFCHCKITSCSSSSISPVSPYLPPLRVQSVQPTTHFLPTVDNLYFCFAPNFQFPPVASSIFLHKHMNLISVKVHPCQTTASEKGEMTTNVIFQFPKITQFCDCIANFKDRARGSKIQK